MQPNRLLKISATIVQKIALLNPSLPPGRQALICPNQHRVVDR